MTTQTPSMPIPGRRGPGRRLRLGLAAGALLAAAGAGLWQVAHDRGDSTATVRQPAAPVERPVPASQIGRAPTYYLVASPAQAERLRAALAEADAIRAQSGEPPLADEVLLVGSAAEAAFVQAALREADAVRGGLGLPGVTVVDLRGPAVASQTGQGPALAGVEALYLVSTEEQAAALRARLAAEAAEPGAPRPPARVVVAGTEAAAIALRVMNDIVPAGLIRLVDRRTP